jgi:hypothetical protein
MTVPAAYRNLKDVVSLSEEDYKLASVLGWCAELVSICISARSSLLADGWHSCKPCSAWQIGSWSLLLVAAVVTAGTSWSV